VKEVFGWQKWQIDFIKTQTPISKVCKSLWIDGLISSS